MPHREHSPAGSENDIDISHKLFDDGDPDLLLSLQPNRKARMEAAENIFDFEAVSESDDADFIAERQAISNRKTSNLRGKSVKKGGGFQAMGLNANLLKAITRKGFTVPTPIQRKTIPMVLDGRDVVGMARTGSGKTAAFVLPMVEKLKTHSAKVGARALIMSPSRELALQTLKVVKEFAKGTDLKCVLLVGGDSLEEQFGFMSANPDIVIATPGRFLHLKVEMGLDLSSIRYMVFDEADRLFEMGFAAQLTEILHALPPTRQTLLFSATLPKSLVEFARAGLQEPSLVRLDAESKISPDLQSAFFSVKSAEKEGALLYLLSEVVKIPTGPTEAALRAKEKKIENNRKRKRGDAEVIKPNESPTAHSTIIFAATKHHVEYLVALLRRSGYVVSYVYGSLDQTARKMQVHDFRTGITHILVVTDVAARGIDIPVLANVINYNFPAQPKIFVHRVGRTARAGQRGWSYSFVQESDAPYLLDLQLFLGRRLILGRDSGHTPHYAEDVVVGGLARDRLERSCEWVSKVLEEDSELLALRSVAGRGEKLYLRTRNAASTESARRSKDVIKSKGWTALHPLFTDDHDITEIEREKMLARVSGFRPSETVFEIGKRGQGDEAVEVMRKRRSFVEAKRKKKSELENDNGGNIEKSEDIMMDENQSINVEDQVIPESLADFGSTSEEEQDVTISHTPSKKAQRPQDGWKDPEFFMSYTSSTTNTAEDRGYGVHSGSYNTASQNANFVEAARGATMDLTNDDGAKAFEPGRPRGMRWDKKNKKYVSRANDEDGSKGVKMIRGESGQKIAASFRSGRFDAWRKSNKIDRMPRTGDAEPTSAHALPQKIAGTRYKHKAEKAPKEADKFRDDYWKRKKKVEAAKEKRLGRFRDGKGQTEIKGVDDVRRARAIKQKRREKNARPGRRKKS
jgi:ATP-dependent RNA helicase DDX54/DBP10